jgi:hypothetical protein
VSTDIGSSAAGGLSRRGKVSESGLQVGVEGCRASERSSNSTCKNILRRVLMRASKKECHVSLGRF